MKKKRENTNLYIGTSFLVVFLIVAVMMKCGMTQRCDEVILNSIVRTEWLTKIMKFITSLGEAWFLLIVGTLITLTIKDKKDGISSLLNLGLIAFINSSIKKIIQRPRPLINHLVEATGYSFPSGHSSSSMAFYGYLIYIIQKKCQSRLIKWLATVLLSVLIVGIGCSRVYLGVHYPSDVIAGFSLAIGCSYLFTWLKDKI